MADAAQQDAMRTIANAMKRKKAGKAAGGSPMFGGAGKRTAAAAKSGPKRRPPPPSKGKRRPGGSPPPPAKRPAGKAKPPPRGPAGGAPMSNAAKRAARRSQSMRKSKSVSHDSMMKGLAKGVRSKATKRKNVTLDKFRGLPLRELVQHLYTLERNNSVRSGLVFFTFFMSFLFICLQLYDTEVMFNTNDTVERRLLEAPFSGSQYKKNFYEVMTHGEFWEWVQDPLVEGLYPVQAFNGRPFNEGELGYMGRYLRLVGGVQLRQNRMSNQSCSERRFEDLTASHVVDGKTVQLGRYDTKGGVCYSGFELSSEDREPFGPGGKYTWSDGYHWMDGLVGYGAAYGTGGFVVELPTDRAGAVTKINELIDDTWTDRGTRSVAVSFNLYNTQTRLLTVGRILFEFYDSGHVTKTAKLFTHPLTAYQARLDFLRLTVEIVYTILWLHYLIIEIREFWMSRPRRKYFRSFTNWYEVALLMLNVVFTYNWILFLVAPQRASFDVNMEQFEDMYSMAESYILTFSYAAVLGLAYSQKIFQFLALSKQMSTLWLTLRRAFVDVMAFIVGFIITVSGFAFMAHYLFGPLLMGFHNLESSFSSLLRFPLGDFDYRELSRARPALAALFFNLYIATVFLVIMNMLIGIITKYFNEVHEEARKVDRWKNSARTWERYQMMRARLSFRWVMLKLSGKRSGPEVEELMTQWNLLQTELAFMQQLQVAVDSAKRHNGLLMYLHFYRLYGDRNSDHIYIGMHELCGLVNRQPCRVGKHERVECTAFKLLKAYGDMKNTTMLGEVRAHRPIESEVLRCSLEVFTVHKLSIDGVNQPRCLVIHPDKHLLLNFTTKMKLRKQLDLLDLVQVHESLVGKNRLILVFRGGPDRDDGDEERSAEGYLLEHSYDLQFMSAQHKDQFLKLLLECKQKLDANNKKRLPKSVGDMRAATGGFRKGFGSSVGSGTDEDLVVLRQQVADLVQRIDQAVNRMS